MTLDEKINELIDIVQSLIYDLRIHEKDCDYYMERLIALKNVEPED